MRTSDPDASVSGAPIRGPPSSFDPFRRAGLVAGRRLPSGRHGGPCCGPHDASTRPRPDRDRRRRQRPGHVHRTRYRARVGGRFVGRDRHLEYARRQPRRDPADRERAARGAAADHRVGRPERRPSRQRRHVHHARVASGVHGARHEHRGGVAGRGRRRGADRHHRRQGQERRDRQHPVDRGGAPSGRRLGGLDRRQGCLIDGDRGGGGGRGRWDRDVPRRRPPSGRWPHRRSPLATGHGRPRRRDRHGPAR